MFSQWLLFPKIVKRDTRVLFLVCLNVLLYVFLSTQRMYFPDVEPTAVVNILIYIISTMTDGNDLGFYA